MNMKQSKIIIIGFQITGLVVLTVLFAIPKIAVAQLNQANIEHGWVNLGYAPGWAGMSFSLANGDRILSLRGLGGFPDDHQTLEFGLMVGKMVRQQTSLISAGIGLGVAIHDDLQTTPAWEPNPANSIATVSEDNQARPAIGIPIEAQLFWRPFNRVGIGIYGFVNVNTIRSFSGVMFCTQWGHLW